MTKQLQLIKLYCTICHYYDTILVPYAQRLSNNFCPNFTDEEAITIYIWGLMNKKFTVKDAYDYIVEDYLDWFPELPGYKTFNNRICYLSDAIIALANTLLEDLPIDEEVKIHVIDSLPVVLANQKRSGWAKVAPEICNKGYCDSKKMWYYGVKVHALAQSRYKTIPVPRKMFVTPASVADLPAGKEMLGDVVNVDLYGDKAYKDKEWEEYIFTENGTVVYTPVKLKRGEERLDSADTLYSAAVSKLRQPIESFFNWVLEKTNMQEASKVRSLKGLLSFIFIRIAYLGLLCMNIL